MMTITTPTVSKLKIICLPFFFLLSLVFYAQEKEIIYITYDEEREINDSLEKIGFTLYPKGRSSFFSYNGKIHKKIKVKFYEIKEKLISKEEANKKVTEYLEKTAKQRQKNALAKGLSNKDAEIIYNVNRYPPVYAFNSYFKKIYIYHVQDEMLYEVNWEYSIDCL